MFAVELETRVGLPVGPTLLGVGVILLAWGLMPKPQKSPAARATIPSQPR